MSDLVITEADGVLRVRLDREAKRNALSDEMATEICAALGVDRGPRRAALVQRRRRLLRRRRPCRDVRRLARVAESAG